MTPFAAALKGAREVGFTVLSMSLSLIAVFIPILLMGGIVGRLFREFAVTLSVGDPGLARRVADHDADDVRAAAPTAPPAARGRFASRVGARASTRCVARLRALARLGAAPWPCS